MLKKLIIATLILLIISCDFATSELNKEAKRPKNGLVNTYNDDGSLSATILYKNDLRHGSAIDYYTDGKLRADIDYVNGVKEGEAKWYQKMVLFTEVLNTLPINVKGLRKNIMKMEHSCLLQNFMKIILVLD